MADDLDAFFSEIAEAETAVAAAVDASKEDEGHVPVTSAPAIVAAAAPSQQPALKRARVDKSDDNLKSEEQILREEIAKLKPVILGNVNAALSSLGEGAPHDAPAPEKPSIYGPASGSSSSLTDTLPVATVNTSDPYQPTETSYSGPGDSSSSSSSSGLAGGLASSITTTATFQKSDKRFVRRAAGVTYVDKTLQEWPENDYRLFVGDLGKETTEGMLQREFSVYKSFAKAKIVRDPSGRTKGIYLLQSRMILCACLITFLLNISFDQFRLWISEFSRPL